MNEVSKGLEGQEAAKETSVGKTVDYKIKGGDTLGKIADEFRYYEDDGSGGKRFTLSRPEAIKVIGDLNGIEPPYNLIEKGEMLEIPVGPDGRLIDPDKGVKAVARNGAHLANLDPPEPDAQNQLALIGEQFGAIPDDPGADGGVDGGTEGKGVKDGGKIADGDGSAVVVDAGGNEVASEKKSSGKIWGTMKRWGRGWARVVGSEKEEPLTGKEISEKDGEWLTGRVLQDNYPYITGWMPQDKLAKVEKVIPAWTHAKDIEGADMRTAWRDGKGELQLCDENGRSLITLKVGLKDQFRYFKGNPEAGESLLEEIKGMARIKAVKHLEAKVKRKEGVLRVSFRHPTSENRHKMDESYGVKLRVTNERTGESELFPLEKGEYKDVQLADIQEKVPFEEKDNLLVAVSLRDKLGHPAVSEGKRVKV